MRVRELEEMLVATAQIMQGDLRLRKDSEQACVDMCGALLHTVNWRVEEGLNWEPANVACVARCLTKIQYYDGSVLDGLAAHFLRHSSAYSLEEMKELLQCMARLNHRHPAYLAAAESCVMERLGEVETGGSAGALMWSVLVLAPDNTALLQALLDRAVELGIKDSSCISSIYQVHMADVGVSIPPDLLQLCRRHRTRPDAYDSTQSQLQRSVFYMLEIMGLTPQAEVMVGSEARGTLCVDMVVGWEVAPGKVIQVAVEVDGPHHYSKNGPPYHADGATALRNLMLRKRCQAVAVVPAWIWEQLSGMSYRKQEYLESLLNAACAHTIA